MHSRIEVGIAREEDDETVRDTLGEIEYDEAELADLHNRLAVCRRVAFVVSALAMECELRFPKLNSKSIPLGPWAIGNASRFDDGIT